MDELSLQPSPHVGDQIVKLLEEDAGVEIVFVCICMRSGVDGARPGILSNIPPEQAEELIMWLGKALPHVRDSRVVSTSANGAH